MIRILQISDIHWLAIPDAMDDYNLMRHEFLDDIESFSKNGNGYFDHLLICGDIAFSGEKEQYTKAKTYIEDICDKIKLNRSEVYVVPGNHDKQRNAGKPALRNLIQSGLACESANDKMFYDLMKGDIESFRNLFVPFKEYRDFSAGYDSVEMMMDKCIECKEVDADHDHAYWESIISDDFYGYQVHLYGFNTSLGCDQNDWDDWESKRNGHKMFLPKFAYNNLHKKKGKHIYISMMHHPTKYLANGSKIEGDLDRFFQLQFYGHVHVSDALQNADKSTVRVFSGAMQPPGALGKNDCKYCPVFNIVELSINKQLDGKEFLHIKLRVNRWNDATNKFEDDNGSSKEFDVEINNNLSRWENTPIPLQPKLPEGITIREIRVKFVSRPDNKRIINSVYHDFFDETQTSHTNNVNFLKKINEDNKWIELWSKMQ